jgi:[ribosomal protein S18]-alanine N-acetyltransferase
MREADLDGVLAIEHGAYRSPWTRQIFAEELEREWARLEVLRERDADGRSRVAGFINYWLVRDEVHLLNLAVDPERRRRGHGRRLMEHLLCFARRQKCRYVTLEVRRSNRAAIDLYKSLDFAPVGVRRNYYVEDQEDALVMLLELA